MVECARRCDYLFTQLNPEKKRESKKKKERKKNNVKRANVKFKNEGGKKWILTV